MDAEYAYHYTREVMLILIREFQSPDEEMKKIVLKVRSSLSDLEFHLFKVIRYQVKALEVEILYTNHKD